MRPTTLCFPVDTRGCLLLGKKKRGFGVSKWNGFGGKIEIGETFRQCAIRELDEETGIVALVDDLEAVGILDFRFSANPNLDHISYIYFIRNYKGIPKETEEMKPCWFPVQTIPYDEMWKGDRVWLPLLLNGHKIVGTICFEPDNETVQSIDINKVPVIEEKKCKYV
ncbi:DNA mismatch repair protein MutT [Megasphaera cerevisiae DSM 20462]|jgi:ADP-ribose pyrophosphatase YjhB (NUDIX family)|uniref:Oxidized purine nucleoside triphosphate hydrolase n=1 Tax=Megasphaera cerevisiae DSM 20462 TaxID=1122219 RepID=A0A0J6WTF0_9FIRM|nr:8-oxo-dGTP diphosphatase [Megasphaera cerevisiae]KMO85438.1 DNA mismatch repair protein MutT [Megasphaera cerevisiae DSM 20462]SKA19030.1 8-oxo-dGTP diphosphatase [Megasphaera cerevisiae DSM 20462]